MAGVVLDTTVLIDLLRGRQDAWSRLRGLRDQGDRPFVCAVNVEEIERGLKGDRESEAARQLFDGLALVPLGLVEGVTAGRWRREFAARGRTLAQADCLIGAAAARVGGRLATGNPKDFPMPGLHVEHWPAGD